MMKTNLLMMILHLAVCSEYARDNVEGAKI